MQSIKTLIDKSVIVCGSQANLAKRLNLQQSVLSEIKNRKRTVAPEIAMLLAEIATANIAEAAFAAIIQNNEGTERGEKLKTIVRKAMLASALTASICSSVSAQNCVSIATKHVKIRSYNAAFVARDTRNYVSNICIVKSLASYARIFRIVLKNVFQSAACFKLFAIK